MVLHLPIRALRRLCVCATVNIVVATTAFARDANPSRHTLADRPELKLAIDSKPIVRSAADRVSYAPVVERTSPSVAFVYSSRSAPAARQLPPELRRFFGFPDGAERLPDRVQRGLGSGVVISKDGYILTNHHVVEGADDVTVSIGNALERHEAMIVGTDALADIAVLKLDAHNLAPATLGDSDQLKTGDVVPAIGNPFGVGLSVSRGIVSALGRGILASSRSRTLSKPTRRSIWAIPAAR